MPKEARVGGGVFEGQMFFQELEELFPGYRRSSFLSSFVLNEFLLGAELFARILLGGVHQLRCVDRPFYHLPVA